MNRDVWRPGDVQYRGEQRAPLPAKAHSAAQPAAPRQRDTQIVGVEAPELPPIFETPESMRAPQPRRR